MYAAPAASSPAFQRPTLSVSVKMTDQRRVRAARAHVQAMSSVPRCSKPRSRCAAPLAAAEGLAPGAASDAALDVEVLEALAAEGGPSASLPRSQVGAEGEGA